MKTQIIQLEPHDNHISIRDKMNWSKTPRILLVFPRRRRFNLDELDLKLLQRHAQSLGAELGLVTKSLKVIHAAKLLGIPTFADNLAAQRGTWTPQTRKQPKRRHKRPNLREIRAEVHPQEAEWRNQISVRLGSLLLAMLALVSLLAAFIPSAQIRLHPARRVQSITIPVRASSEISEVFITGSVPAQTVHAVLTEKRSMPASGRLAIPSKGASGTVVFRNLTDQLIRIPQGTVIRSIDDPNIRFQTDFEAIVNPGVDQSIEVPVSALSFGEGGNLDPNLLQAIEGELRFSLAATNPAPTTGGSDELVRVPTLRDRDDLREQILFALTTDPEALVADALDQSDIFFPDTLGEIEVLEEKFAPEEGEPADRLTLEMQVAVDAQYAKASDLEILARAALAANLPQGFTPEADSLTYAPVGELETDTLGVTTFQMRVEQALVPRIAQPQVASWIQGKSLASAARILENNLELEDTAEIILSPAWWKWLPIAPFRIAVVVE